MDSKAKCILGYVQKVFDYINDRSPDVWESCVLIRIMNKDCDK